MRLTTAALKKVRRYLVGKFVDSAKVEVRGGAGGAGLARFGGTGGGGGDVVLQASARDSLDAFVKRWRKIRVLAAEDGQKSAPGRIFGQRGADRVLAVPLGVAAYRLTKGRGGDLIGELNDEGERLVVAAGGAGGGPDNEFEGQAGGGVALQIDLKLIADVGLVGFPNAGKSTLLRAVSQARPKVAAYPFTTVRPEVGVIEYPDRTKVSMADLPGLLEGAHLNHGLGHSFLRHIERTKLLVLVADASGFRLSPHHPRRSCLDTVVLLNRELELYDPTLLAKPALLVVNKLDEPGAEQVFQSVREQVGAMETVLDAVPDDVRPSVPIKFQHVFGISAKDGPDAVVELKKCIRQLLGELHLVEDQDDYHQDTKSA